jgi:phosphopantothenoylcysteine decarboxylase/phosphopantothenate--cysteine ligase
MENKKVLIGVTGGAAIYKICGLVRLFKRNDFRVRMVMTQSATKLISPSLFQALSGTPVATKLFHPEEEGLKHISLSQWADLFIVAPATANTISKIASGIADNLLTSTVLAFPSTSPLLIAPAMNNHMWENEATQNNIKIIESRTSYHLVGPETGLLTNGQKGKGRMTEAEEIFTIAKKLI